MGYKYNILFHHITQNALTKTLLTGFSSIYKAYVSENSCQSDILVRELFWQIPLFTVYGSDWFSPIREQIVQTNFTNRFDQNIKDPTPKNKSFMNRTALIRRYKTQNKRENTNNCTCNRVL